MLHICRICLREVMNKSFVSLEHNRKSLQIRRELSYCIPEINLDLVSNPILCEPCVATLHLTYLFQNKCYRSEKIIKNYMYSNKLNPGEVSLEEYHERAKDTEYPQIMEFEQRREQPYLSNRMEVVNPVAINNTAVPRPIGNINEDLLKDLNNALDEILVNDLPGLRLNNQNSDEQIIIKTEVPDDDNMLDCFNMEADLQIKEEASLNISRENPLEPPSIFDEFNDIDIEDEFVMPEDNTVKPCFVKLVPLQYELSQNDCDLPVNDENAVEKEVPDQNDENLPPPVNENGTVEPGLEKQTEVREENNVTSAKRITFACEVCGKEFPLQFHLQHHMKSHDERKPYVCNYCSFTTTLQYTYRIHVEMHKINQT